MPEKPLVSFIVLAYKQERFIREAVRSALAQTYEPLEVIMSDDCSPDGTYKIIQEEAAAYRGIHKIILNRNLKNLGLAGNINRAWELSHGDFVVTQGGDDVSLPHRSVRLVQEWLAHNQQLDLIYSSVLRIDVNGKELGIPNVQMPPADIAELLDTKKNKKWFIASGAACGYSRRIHSLFGPLDNEVSGEDAVYSFRALLGGGASFIPEPLVRYRWHDQNISRPKDWRHADIKEKCRWAMGQLAVRREFLKAWDVSGHNNAYIRRKLRCGIRLAELDLWGVSKGRIGTTLAALYLTFAGRPRTALNWMFRDSFL